MSDPANDQIPTARRTFLVVVDDTEEMHAALRFACGRARTTDGRVALMRVAEQPDFQHFKFIGDKMETEAREAAEMRLQRLAAEVQKTSGTVPMLIVREGRPVDQILEVIKEEPDIAVLVLAAGAGKDGPGPLISGLSGSFGAKLRIPVVVVPAGLSPEDIDRLT